MLWASLGADRRVVGANVIGEGDDECIEGNVSVPSFIIIDIYFEAPQHR